MIPPRYSLIPTAAMNMTHVPVHLRWTYYHLYALAWTHQYQWLDESLQQLSAFFSDLEGKQITVRGIRHRLSELAQYGLVERRRIGSRQYRTYLLVRHDQLPEQPGKSGNVGGPVAATQTEVGVSLECHPININGVDDVSLSHQERQQHQYSNMGDIEENERILMAIGINNPIRRRLAREPWVNTEYLESWMAYRAAQAARGNFLGPGFMVEQIGNAEEPPVEWERELEDEGERYVTGKYRDYIQS